MALIADSLALPLVGVPAIFSLALVAGLAPARVEEEPQELV